MNSFDLHSYASAKKWLYILSGAEIIALYVGLEMNERAAISLVPVRFTDTEAIPWVLAAAVLLLMLRMAMLWSALDLRERRSVDQTYDFALAHLCGAVALALFAFELPLAEAPWPWPLAPFALAAGFMLMLGARHAIPALLIESLAGLLNGNLERDGAELARLATLTRYRLFFQPGDPSLAKIMRFEDGGGISAGANSNETTWRIRDGALEILNAEGRVFSRFRFDRRRLAWLHTNDRDTLSTRNQFMLIVEEDAPPPTTHPRTVP